MKYKVELYDTLLLRTVMVVLEAKSADEAKEKAFEQVGKSINYSIRSVKEVECD